MVNAQGEIFEWLSFAAQSESSLSKKFNYSLDLPPIGS
jgi:hypothetical protein